MAKTVYVIDPKDNVATVVAEGMTAGTSVEVTVEGKAQIIRLRQDIPFGHKFALRPIAKGERVLKYGFSIGTATEDIAAGQYVHLHNVESNRGRGDLKKEASTS